MKIPECRHITCDGDDSVSETSKPDTSTGSLRTSIIKIKNIFTFHSKIWAVAAVLSPAAAQIVWVCVLQRAHFTQSSNAERNGKWKRVDFHYPSYDIECKAAVGQLAVVAVAGAINASHYVKWWKYTFCVYGPTTGGDMQCSVCVIHIWRAVRWSNVLGLWRPN